MVVVKKNWLSATSIPLSVKAFGKNKTLRGFLVLPFLSGSLVAIFSQLFGPFSETHSTDILIGIGLGVVYLLSELPNSFVKRKLGIGNGEHSQKYRLLQIFADKSDSLIGMLIFYYFATPVELITVIQLFVLALGVSLAASFLLYKFKLRKSF
jgi:hypothetical protein